MPGGGRGARVGSHTLDLVPDALGRVREAKSHVAGSVQETTGYDALGRKTSAKDEVVGLEEALEYQDVLGRLTHRQRWITSGSERLLREEWRTYADAPGAHTVVINETVQTGGDGTRTTRRAVTFDGAGRVTEEKRTVLTEDGAKDAYRRWEYDALGHVRFERWSTTASDVLAAVEQVYDAAGYLVERKEADGTSTKYVTDASGAVAEQVGPHERERWKFVYDALGRQSEKRLVGAGADVPEAVWSYGYGVSGATTEETSPAGYVTRRTLNGRGKVLKEEKKDVGGTRPTSNVLVVDSLTIRTTARGRSSGPRRRGAGTRRGSRGRSTIAGGC